mgnify:FL=1|tara:strand:+ start:498 stop:1376 length:879 start_codon:yes stop_codon:yes gene_type:complete
MVGIVLGSALGTIADTMKENREYLKEKKSLLQERMVMSGLENRAALKKARAERTARLDAAMGLGFSERAATALELTGQLEFQLAKIANFKDDLDPTYIPNLTSGLESRIDDNEELAKAVAEGLSGPLNSIEDQENAFQRALKSTSITDFDEELNKLIMYTGGTPNSYSEKFSITPSKGSVITDPEFKNIDSIITDALSVLYSDVYETDSEGRTRIKLDQPGGEEVKFLFNNLSKEATKIAQDPFNTFSTVGAAQFIIDKITPASGLPASVVNENLNESLTSSEPSYWDRFRN